ncbi:hypothetical protein ACH4UA_24665 [Streptomyces sp. NPDC020939]|uniref:hypothetical protein n=1 Tax=unclassified Streptomyces TaxID=2593676 RepID=UPI0037B7A6F3
MVGRFVNDPTALQERTCVALEATVGDDGMVYIRETEQPDVVAVTTTAKWEAFVKGVLAGEFDHFAADLAGGETAPARSLS